MKTQLLVGAYLIAHIIVMTKYAPIGERTELDAWLYTLQWLLPTIALAMLIPQVQRLLNRVANINIWTGKSIIIITACILIYFINPSMRWFAWSTLGLLILLMTLVANRNRLMGNVNAWLLGAMVALLAIGSWEVLYQTGLLVYYDFFGCSRMSYYVTVALQFMWIIPALIVILVLHTRGLYLNISRTTLACISVSIVTTILWFAGGMDIPLLWWQGSSGLEGPIINEAARPLMISVSRASQGFWLVGIASIFIGVRRII